MSTLNRFGLGTLLSVIAFGVLSLARSAGNTSDPTAMTFLIFVGFVLLALPCEKKGDS